MVLCASMALLVIRWVHLPGWSPVVQAWAMALGMVLATQPLANMALAQWYAMGRFATGNAWVLAQRAVVLMCMALASLVVPWTGALFALLGVAVLAWCLAGMWRWPLLALQPALLALPSASKAHSTPPPGAKDLWKESTHYLVWGLMMACYGPLPLSWAMSQDVGLALWLGTALTLSGLLALYVGAATVPWMNEVQRAVGDSAGFAQHQKGCAGWWVRPCWPRCCCAGRCCLGMAHGWSALTVRPG